MADYSKKKNDDLIALCKARGLAHTGKKADFVSRLEEYDAKQTTAKPSAAEDEIDWDDEPAPAAGDASTAPAADAMAAGGVGRVDNPAAVPNQTVVEDPATTDDLVVASAPDADTAAPPPDTAPATEIAPANAAAPAAKAPSPEKDFSTGLADRTILEEVAKRKARARKYGMPEDSDEIRALERAAKFGTGTGTSQRGEGQGEGGRVPGMLNQALSSGHGQKRDREREGRAAAAGQKRGLDAPLGEVDGAAGRKRSRGAREQRGGGGPRSSSRGGRGEGRNGAGRGGGGGGEGGAWMNDADRAAAESRKARFAGTTS
ncbi:hypothetical protein LTR53_013976 [Teratosphaeriaceae sp. CCFEE 6253]|nr:hypothetical protein LTR53_013976 [Teratosphaeriaceae sp. CCFEE 6253]